MRLTENWRIIGFVFIVVIWALCYLCGRTQVKRKGCTVISVRERDIRVLALMMLGGIGIIGYMIGEVILFGWIAESWLLTILVTVFLMILSMMLSMVCWIAGDYAVKEAARKQVERCRAKGGGRADCEHCKLVNNK